MIKKVGFILDKRQKINFFLLLVIIIFGALGELLGVSAIMPVVYLVLDESVMYSNKWFELLTRLTNIHDIDTMLIFLSSMLIVIYIVKNIYVVFMNDIQFRYIYNNQKKIATKLMKGYLDKEYIFHTTHNVAELQRNLTTDVNNFFTLITVILQLISQLTISLLLGIFLYLNDAVTMISFISFIFAFTILFYYIYKKYQVKLGNQNRQVTANLTKWILQTFGGIKEIKVLGKEDFFNDRYNAEYSLYAIIMRRYQTLSILGKPVLETACIGGLLGVLIFRVVNGFDMASFGTTMAVFAVTAMKLLPAANGIVNSISSILFYKPSVDSLYEDLRVIGEESGKRSLAYACDNLVMHIDKDISVDNISFRYDGEADYVLQDISVILPRNKTIAFIGPSGAGKTTLIDIILGILKPERGQILVDGINIQDGMSRWHENIGYIPQTIYLTDDTIRSNIAYGVCEEYIDDEQVWHALKDSQLDGFVKNLDKGLDTIVGDRGVRLSGGQKQRIGIARALYNNPQVLILDEATSALDGETEKAVMDAIVNLQGSRTILIVAHRLTTIQTCDLIYEVKNKGIRQCTKEEVFNVSSDTNKKKEYPN